MTASIPTVPRDDLFAQAKEALQDAGDKIDNALTLLATSGNYERRSELSYALGIVQGALSHFNAGADTMTGTTMPPDEAKHDELPNPMSEVFEGIAVDFYRTPQGTISGYWFPIGVANAWRQLATAAANAYQRGWNNAKAEVTP